MAKQTSSRNRDPRSRPAIRIADLNVCYFCKSAPFPPQAVKCPVCGFPQRGTAQEPHQFLAVQRFKKKELNESENSVAFARVVLGIIAALNFLIAGIIYYNFGLTIFTILYAVISLTYILLIFTSVSNPYGSLLAGLIVYLSLLLLNFLMMPSTLFQGIFLKAAIISGLVYGMADVKRRDKLREQNKIRPRFIPEENNSQQNQHNH